MRNVFRFYGVLWLTIIILYLLQWSDLFEKLNIGVSIFLIIIIILSFSLGKLFENYFSVPIVSARIINEKHNKIVKKGKLICAYFVIFFLIARKIPLISVLQGQSISDITLTTIPGITIFMTAYVIYASFEFSFMYAFYGDKHALKYNIIIFAYFILMVNRQYILVCLAMFLYTLYIGKFNASLSKTKKIVILIIVLVLAIFLLYGFGVMGNMRFGDKWAWNDSSMIFTLGKGNFKWPEELPKEFFWGYIYFASPLANFNSNVVNFQPNNNISQFITEFIPNVISSKLNMSHASVYLPVPSLNVSTAFIGAYRTVGILGSFIILLLIFIITSAILMLTYKYRPEQMMPQICGIMYIMLMSIFTNPFTFSVTGMLIVLMFVECFRFDINNLSVRN